MKNENREAQQMISSKDLFNIFNEAIFITHLTESLSDGRQVPTQINHDFSNKQNKCFDLSNDEFKSHMVLYCNYGE